jgi:hypothetical protein
VAGIKKASICFRIAVPQWESDKRFGELVKLFDRHKGVTDEITFFHSETHSPIPGSVIRSSRKPTTVVGQKPSRKSRTRTQDMRCPCHVMATAVLALAAIAGCAPMRETAPSLLEDQFRQELAAEPPDSDAAWILTEALEEAAKASPEGRPALLQAARERAAEARRFEIVEESPLPKDWPRPSLPGLVRISYPPVRSAWVRAPDNRNGQFMVLFRHIQDQQIAMTAPVVMEYSAAAARDPSKLSGTEAMAFLYRQPDQGKPGTYGAVAVENDRPLRVVSVGLQGSYREANFRKALVELRQWLDAHPEWQKAGPPRVLGYNSPFMLWWRKYSEVQIPVAPADNGAPSTTQRPAKECQRRTSGDDHPSLPSLTKNPLAIVWC